MAGHQFWLFKDKKTIEDLNSQHDIVLFVQTVFMAEILHQLRLVVFPIVDRVSYILGGAGFQPSTVSWCHVIMVYHEDTELV